MIRVDIMISSKIKDIRFLRETFLKTSDSFFWKTGEKCLGKSQARGTAPLIYNHSKSNNTSSELLEGEHF